MATIPSLRLSRWRGPGRETARDEHAAVELSRQTNRSRSLAPRLGHRATPEQACARQVDARGAVPGDVGKRPVRVKAPLAITVEWRNRQPVANVRRRDAGEHHIAAQIHDEAVRRRSAIDREQRKIAELRRTMTPGARLA